MSSFPFLKLPPELRQTIYRHVLVREEQPIRPITWGGPDRPSKFTAILATSRAIYLEALPTLHSGNQFAIGMLYEDFRWLENLGLRGRNELRNVLLWTCGNPSLEHASRFFILLSQCANLALTIEGTIYEIHELRKCHQSRHLHGFGHVSMVQTEPAAPNDACFHRFCGSHVEFEQAKKTLGFLAKQLGSPCRKSCRVHRGESSIRPRASVHVEGGRNCFHCCSI